jgi:hypothetical protein
MYKDENDPQDNVTEDHNLIPSAHQADPLDQQAEPGQTNQPIAVPQAAAQAGHDTNEPQADSPESLDQDIQEGAERTQLNPDDNMFRPGTEPATNAGGGGDIDDSETDSRL